MNPDSPGNTPFSYFPQDALVYYSFDSNITNGEQINQINTALSNWESANFSNNCSGVRFRQGIGPSGNPTLTFRNTNQLAAGVAAQIVRNNVDSVDNTIQDGTVLFNPQTTYTDGSLFYDPNKAGYSTVYLKQTLHEVGHLMGMTHYRTCLQLSQPPQN